MQKVVPEFSACVKRICGRLQAIVVKQQPVFAARPRASVRPQSLDVRGF